MRQGFNPRARRGARVANGKRYVIRYDLVSILARAEARALPKRAVSNTLDARFQSSRAPRRARCAIGNAAGWWLFPVSILARAEARALPMRDLVCHET